MKISSFFKPLSFLPALALMYMIFTFSSQNAESSSSLSYQVSRKMVQAVNTVTNQGWDEWQIEAHTNQIHKYVRKGAHITEYFLLAIAVSFPLYVYGVRGILLMILAGLICVGYACTDEYHQSLVSGRAASLRDVLIDSIGIFFGVILTRLIGWSGRMAITGPAYERRQKKQQMALDAREEELRRREDALRREEIRYRRERSYQRAPRSQEAYPGLNAREVSFPDGRSAVPYQGGRESGVPYQDAGASAAPYQGAVRPGVPYPGTAAQDDALGRTRVIGTKHEVDDRTRVYRSEEEQRRMEEEYQRQTFERRQVQSRELQEDNTSDQLAEELPFSKLFKKKD